MKKLKFTAAAAALAVTASALTLFAAGDEPTWDPAADPLISLSYVNDILVPSYDAKLAELSAAISTLDTRLIESEKKVAALATTNAALMGENASLRAEIEALKAEDAAIRGEIGEGWEIVCLKKGAKLLAESPVEVILRSGTALVVSIAQNGVNDISTGTELSNAAEVPLFHCLIVPRGGDGRGVQVTSAEAYLMVRGDYSIVD